MSCGFVATDVAIFIGVLSAKFECCAPSSLARVEPPFANSNCVFTLNDF